MISEISDHVTFGGVAKLRPADLIRRVVRRTGLFGPPHCRHRRVESTVAFSTFDSTFSANFIHLKRFPEFWRNFEVATRELIWRIHFDVSRWIFGFAIDAWNCDACEWTSFKHKNGSQVVLKSRVRATRWELNLSAGPIDGHISCCRENHLVALDLFTFKWHKQGVRSIVQIVIRTTQVPPVGP